jgi:SWIM zinc finger
MAAASYDKGRPKPCRPLGENRYAVDSWRGEDAAYEVTLGAHPSCTCPHFTGRLAGTGEVCKHIIDVRRQQRWLAVAERARKLTDAELLTWLKIHQTGDDLIVCGAIRYVRHERQAAARKDAELKAVFA